MRGPIIMSSVVAILLFAPLGAASPLAITPTGIGMQLDLLGEGSTLNPGDRAEGFAFTFFCFEWPAANPMRGSFHYTFTIVSAPDWLDVRIAGGNVKTDTPPIGPEFHARCYDIPILNLSVTAHYDAPRGHTGTITVAVNVAPEGDTGTYQTPDGTTASGTIRISG